jgi:hypothetical protein
MQAKPGPETIGTHIPFTAPQLTGVCGRISNRTLDFVLPNPSGGRGTYIVSWKMATEYGSPTLHDSMLARRLKELPNLNPIAVREAARAVAIEGYAGRASAEAAHRARARLEAETLRQWSSLLMALIEASEIPVGDRIRALAGLGAAGPNVTTDGFNQLAIRLRWDPPGLSDALARLSAATSPLTEGGRITTLLERLAALHPALVSELDQCIAATGQAPVALQRTVGLIGRCLTHIRSVAQRAMNAVEQPVELFLRWRNNPIDALDPIQALECVLDGWDRISLLWLDGASLTDRIATLPEISLLVRLAAGRLGTIEDDQPSPTAASDSYSIPRAAAAIPESSAADGIPVLRLVERNERIRARELELEHGHG